MSNPADTPAEPGTVDDIPAAAKTLVKALAPGWTANITHAHGPMTRKRRGVNDSGAGCYITETVDVNSVCLRATHRDGRGLVALWVQPPGKTPTGKTPGYGFDMAWRGRHHDETVPAPLKAAEAKAYAAALDPDTALAAVQTVRDDQVAATEARRAAKNATKRAEQADGETIAALAIPAQRQAADELTGAAA